MTSDPRCFFLDLHEGTNNLSFLFILERFSGTSLTFTESDDDSDDDKTVFDKKFVNGKTRMNGTINGKVKYKDHAM